MVDSNSVDGKPKTAKKEVNTKIVAQTVTFMPKEQGQSSGVFRVFRGAGIRFGILGLPRDSRRGRARILLHS